MNRGTLITLHTVGVISDAEFKQAVVPGLERTVPKNKGAESARCCISWASRSAATRTARRPAS